MTRPTSPHLTYSLAKVFPPLLLMWPLEHPPLRHPIATPTLPVLPTRRLYHRMIHLAVQGLRSVILGRILKLIAMSPPFLHRRCDGPAAHPRMIGNCIVCCCCHRSLKPSSFVVVVIVRCCRRRLLSSSSFVVVVVSTICILLWYRMMFHCNRWLLSVVGLRVFCKTSR